MVARLVNRSIAKIAVNRRRGASSPPPTDPFALLTPAQAAVRASVLAQVDGGWNPTTWNSIVWDSIITPTSCSQLNSWFSSGAAIGGVTRNVLLNQKIVIPATGFSYNAALNFKGMGGVGTSDWAGNGKVLGLTCENGSSQPFLTQLTIYGIEGLFIYDFGFTMGVTESGGTPSWCPEVDPTSIVITAGGSGYVVGDEVKLAGSVANVYLEPKFTVAAVSGGAVTALTIKAGDPKNAGTVTSVSVAAPLTTVTGSGSGATITCNNGVSPRDTNVLVITRNSQSPRLSKVRIENCKIGYGHRGAPQLAQPWEYLSGFRTYSCEQVDVINCQFLGVQTGMNIVSARRRRCIGNDFRRMIGDVMITTNTDWNDVFGGFSLAANYSADARIYGLDRLNTERDLWDDCEMLGPSGNYFGMFLEHSDVGQCGNAGTGDVASFLSWSEFCVHYRERGTEKQMADGNWLSGGSQGFWTRGHPTNNEYRRYYFNCAIDAVSLNSFVWWSGDSEAAYCSAIRAGSVPAHSGDISPSILSRRGPTSPNVYTHKINNSIFGALLTGVASPANDSQDKSTGQVVPVDAGGNLVIDPAGGLAGSDYPAAFPALSCTQDAAGQVVYPFTDDGAETPAAFRARMFSTFGKSGAGITNPANWPAA